MPAIGTNRFLVPFERFEALYLAVEAVGYQATCPSAPFATITPSDFLNAARKKPTVHPESHAVSFEGCQHSPKGPEDTEARVGGLFENMTRTYDKPVPHSR
jgi:hypothetical protein